MRLFYPPVFPGKLVKSTPTLLSFLFSPLPLCASCTKLTNVLSVSLLSLYLTLLEPSFNTKLLLCCGTGPKTKDVFSAFQDSLSSSATLPILIEFPAFFSFSELGPILISLDRELHFPVKPRFFGDKGRTETFFSGLNNSS